MVQVQNFIGSRWVPPRSGQYLENRNPATGEVFSMLADSEAADVEMAVRAARAAFPAWSALPAVERASWLRKIADRIEMRMDEFARAESQDQGKPVALAKSMDIARVILNFRFFADEILRTEDENFDEVEAHNYVLRKPVGVAGLISPWNLPLYLLSWKIAPALAAGNTVVCKPSEFTSMTAHLLAEVLTEINFPSGVINIIYGLGAKAGEALVRHPEVPLISFTGGTVTGRRIYQQSAEHFKKLSLELGGKNPNLIFADCDLEEAVAGSLRSSFLNQGEICLCGSRILLEKKIKDQFLERFIADAQKLSVGDPSDPGTFMGPLISAEHLKKVLGFFDVAHKEGGKFLLGGEKLKLSGKLSGGYFLAPTVIDGLGQSSACVQEEIFGPVVTIQTFESEDEALALANGVRYGLSASVWSEDIARAERVAAKLEAGTVWINTWLLRDLRMPFGGMKHSGLGREGGRHSMDFFTELTAVSRKK